MNGKIGNRYDLHWKTEKKEESKIKWNRTEHVRVPGQYQTAWHLCNLSSRKTKKKKRKNPTNNIDPSWKNSRQDFKVKKYKKGKLCALSLGVEMFCFQHFQMFYSQHLFYSQTFFCPSPNGHTSSVRPLMWMSGFSPVSLGFAVARVTCNASEPSWSSSSGLMSQKNDIFPCISFHVGKGVTLTPSYTDHLTLKYKKLKGHKYMCVYMCVWTEVGQTYIGERLYFWDGIGKLDYCHFKWERRLVTPGRIV